MRTIKALLGRIVLTALSLGFASNATACPGPESEHHVTRATPVKHIPEGAVQLEVDVPGDEDELRSDREGIMTLPVTRVVIGEFSEKSVNFSYSLQTSCDYFGPTGKRLYLVIYPYRYAEGDPVLSEAGKPEVVALLLPPDGEPDYSEGPIYPDFDVLPDQLSCFRRGKILGVNNYFDKCVEAKDPKILYRTASPPLASDIKN